MAEDDVKGALQGLPMSDLIGAPLTAVCDAQMKLAYSQYTFIKRMGFNEDNGETRLIEFNLQRPVELPDGKVDMVDTQVQAPFLGLIPIPSLLIEDVNIEFQMEVSATASTREKLDAETSVKASASGGFAFVKASVEVQGKVSSSRENTRNTNQTAKYQVRVAARQQQQTEGLSRLMDVMAQCTAPFPTKAK